ncbi:hypothetical protein BsWGS_25400 [Bradybaena similaris]
MQHVMTTSSRFGHATRHDKLSKIILQGRVEGGRRRGGQRKSWNDNIKGWTGCSIYTIAHVVENRERWHALITNASIVTPQLPMLGLPDELVRLYTELRISYYD